MQSDFFNINRFILLAKQHIIHNHRIILMSLVGFSGGLFMLFLFMQLASDFTHWGKDQYLATFFILFVITSVVYCGVAFPEFRSREKSYNYLLNPASVFEKFLLEFLCRVVFVIVVIPFLFWLIFTIEASIVKMARPEFHYETFSYTQVFNEMEFRTIYCLLVSSLLILVVPFTGTTIFSKYPLVKTFFSIVILFFAHMLIFLLLIRIGVFDLHRSGPGTFLFMSREEDITMFLAVYCTVINLALLTVGYLKIKEKEV